MTIQEIEEMIIDEIGKGRSCKFIAKAIHSAYEKEIAIIRDLSWRAGYEMAEQHKRSEVQPVLDVYEKWKDGVDVKEDLLFGDEAYEAISEVAVKLLPTKEGIDDNRRD